MSNAAKFETPDSGDDGKTYVYNSGTDAHVLTDMATQAELNTHEADTTSVHGITDTSTLYRSGGTDVAVADGGTGASTAAAARTNLGLGTIATQDASAVAVTGGSVTGITDLAVADGGTGASTAANARTNLGLGTIATQDAATVAITGGSVTGITDLAVADGGTGASTAAAARTNLGLVIGTDIQAYDADLAALAAIAGVQGDVIYHNGTSWVRLAAGTNGNFLKTQGAAANPTWASIPGGGDLLAANNLSDVANAATARTNLGLAIGTNVQAYDAELAAVAGLTSAADKVPYFTGSGTAALADLTATGRALIDDASVSAQRVTLQIDKRTTVNNTTYSILSTDSYVAQTGTMSASRAFTLPAASAVNAGYEFIIGDESGTVTSTNTIVITRAGSDTINGATTETIGTAYGWRRLISDGTSKWTFDGGVLRHSLATAKGDILAASAASTITRLAVGTDGYVLTADSAQSTGIKWAAASGGSGSVATDTIWDAKGDLAGGTGADTAAKLTVGTNGYVLGAASAQTTGLNWVRPATNTASPSVPAVSTFYYTGTNGALAAGKSFTTEIMLAPLVFGLDVTLDRIGVYVSTTHASSTAIRLGIYNSKANGRPGTLLLDAGTIDASATTGLKELTISQALTANTLYYTAFTNNAGSALGWGQATGAGVSWDLGRTSSTLDTDFFRVYDGGNTPGAFRDLTSVTLTLASAGSYVTPVVRIT